MCSVAENQSTFDNLFSHEQKHLEQLALNEHDPAPIRRQKTPPFLEASSHEVSPTSTAATTTTTHTSPSVEPSPCMSFADLSPTIDADGAKNMNVSLDVINTAAEVVGSFLNHLCVYFSDAPTHKTSFDALCEPKISVDAYYGRIRQYSQATPESCIAAAALVRKLCTTDIVLTNYNVHRLLIASVMVFAKFYDDDNDSNARWAKIGGLKKHEMNNLEIEILNRLHFDLRIAPSTFHDTVLDLIRFKNNPPQPEQKCCVLSQVADIALCSTKKNHRSTIRAFHVRSSDGANHHHEGASGATLVRTRTHDDVRNSKILTFFQPTPHLHLQSMSIRDNGNDSCFSTPTSGPVKPCDSTKKKLPRPLSFHSVAGLLHKSPSLFKIRPHK